jgi:histidinol-phosphate aminotransferase
MSFLDTIKPCVRALELYSVDGKPAQQGLIKLNQNENPFDIPDELKRKIIDDFFARQWNRYPEVFPTSLIQALSKYTNHPAEGIIVGNGSNELMYTVAMTVIGKGSKVLIPSPSFFLYEKLVLALEGELISVPMNEDLSFSTARILSTAKAKNPSLIFLVSPNSPTGQSVPLSDVERIVQGTNGLVVVDEAYIDFSEKKSVQQLIDSYDRIIVLRTFSKAFSMAGLRIGYLLGQPQVCHELLKTKIPFSVNNFSASVAETLMKNDDIIIERIAYLKRQKTELLSALRRMKDVTVFPSDTNFLIFRTKFEAKTLFQKLLERNILVRNVSSYPMLSNMLRVNTGTQDENQKFLSALAEILEEKA